MNGFVIKHVKKILIVESKDGSFILKLNFSVCLKIVIMKSWGSSHSC